MAAGTAALTERQREAYDDLKRAGWLGIGNGYARRTLDALVTAGLAAWRYNDGAQLTIGGPDSTCGTCGREWHSRSLPTPAARCPWEHEHDDEPRQCVSCGDEPHALSSRDLCDGCEEERDNEPRQAVSVSAFRGDDGATVVQIDTSDEMTGRLRVNVNDGPAVADFDPATQDSEAERARRARDVLAAYVPWADSSERRDAQARMCSSDAMPGDFEAYAGAKARYLLGAESILRDALAALS